MDMEVSEIIRQAHDRGEAFETYDPNQLVADVRTLLIAHGLHPDATGRMGAATGAAGQLLRAFAVVPGTSYTTIDRLNAPDAESR